MSITECWRTLGIPVAQSVVDAGQYLESLGFRFLVDFGVENAVTKAAHEFTRRSERQFGRRSL